MTEVTTNTSIADTIGRAFDAVIKKNYNHLIAPEPYMTPTGIRHLDALLGGGIISSGPVLLSSTPETGKSTFAFQLAGIFQKTHDNSIVIYVDIEGSSSVSTNQYRISRIDAFGLSNNRFMYQTLMADVMTLFELFEKMIQLKIEIEKRRSKEINLLIIWDSVAATPSSKVQTAENPDKIIGTKARQISFCLDKYAALFKFNKITFIGIDQVRADLNIEGPYAPRKEISVGRFKNRDVKSASNIYSLQHLVQQWLFLSKGSAINLSDGLGIDGWEIEIYTEKNKLAPSQCSVSCVFDKSSGIDKFWSEFLFLQQKTPTEKKIYKDKNLPFPLMIKTSGSYVYLDVSNPEDSSVKYTSQKFYRKSAKKKYTEEDEFRSWFDYAVNLSVQYRIVNGLFRTATIVETDEINVDANEDLMINLETAFDSIVETEQSE